MPFEGDRKIALVGRAPTTRSATGVDVETGPAPRIEVWARREDRGGSRRVIDDAEAGAWDTVFVVRHSALMDSLGLDESWQLIDERGRPHSIERIAEATYAPGGAIWYRLHAMRITTGQDNV